MLFGNGRACLLACGCLLLMASTSAYAALTDGLIHYWPLDEVGGAVAHDVAGANDALLLNWSATEPRWVSGTQGNALDFGTNPKGNDNVLKTNDEIVYDEYTVSFFMQTRFDAEKVNSRVFGPDSHYWIVINQEFGKGVGFYYDHGNTTLLDQTPPAIGKWEHYSITLNRVTGRSTIFRDGFPVATGLMPNYAKEYPAGSWNFGHPGDPATHDGRGALSGLLDEIRIYNRVLSPDEIIVLSGIATAGDFDHNGVLDVLDIDALTRAVRSGQNSAEFDINSDGQVDQEDRRVWVVERKGTYFGDANLDGEFGTGDLVHAFLRGKYEVADAGDVSWQDGDWNGDGVFNSGDLVAAFQAGSYEMGPRTAIATVPEPGSLATLVAGLLVMGCMPTVRHKSRCSSSR
ncbi:MAG: hypothetical protein KDB23_14530 [Planctomycetales bacterium]|nr:hypothetical protein [Planctomycetales bacterium]